MHSRISVCSFIRRKFPYISIYQLERVNKHAQSVEHNNIIYSAGMLFIRVFAEINKRISLFRL